MPESPTGVIPEPLFYPHLKDAVIQFLRAAPVHGSVKLDWLDGWSIWTGAQLTDADRDMVLHSGIDYPWPT